MVVLGVTGSIAAYKAAEILRGLTKAGQDVHVVMTPAALQFVGALTFQGLSGRPVLSDPLDPRAYSTAHLQLAEQAKAIVIAPASAETLSRLACGSTADLVCAVALSVPRDAKGRLAAPVFVAPAMHDSMWKHPATQENVQRLKQYGYQLIGPEHGALSRPGDQGEGRLADPATIVKIVLKGLSL
jgi:phosphopantothenoylcysteine decarboxylase/phosphopantothenate--cysteine ligase